MILTPEQDALREAARDFAARELGAGLAARDADGASAPDSWRSDWQRAAKFGALRQMQPADLGGLGRDVVAVTGVMEGLGQGCADNGLMMHLCAQLFAIQAPMLSFATPAQRAAFLPGLGSGDLIGAYALTEAETGSDAMSLQTRARRDGDHYILSGEKSFVGMAPVADLFLVFASTRPEHKHWGVSVFLVRGDDPGLVRLDPQEKVGLRTVPMGGIRFDDLRLPADRLLGKEGSGHSIFQHSMLWERGLILASHVGAMARQLEEAVAFAKTRVIGGKPIFTHQSVSNRLADMALRVETARLMLYRTAEALQSGQCSAALAAMCNLTISEGFVASSLDAMRIHGGRGVLSGMGPEQDLRDALGGVIYSGTSDIQRQVIAGML